VEHYDQQAEPLGALNLGKTKTAHGPRGDIVSVYTTFPWPAFCEEVGKLKISLREGKLLDGSFGALLQRLLHPSEGREIVGEKL
jgi:hypothetical protein